MRRSTFILFFSITAWLRSFAAEAPPTPVAVEKIGSDYRFTLAPSVGYYLKIEGTPDIAAPFQVAGMTLDSPPTFLHSRGDDETAYFIRAEGISVFAPRDSDFDGMDDLWELAHNLNPLDAADANQASPNIAGLTNLEEYRRRFGLNGEKPQFYSREVSLFNFGAPTARYEAISREQSVFNFGSAPFRIEAVGRELSVFNGERPGITGYPEAYSREQSVFNFGSPPFHIEAVGRELSVFNGERPGIAGYPEAYSREVSLFNFGAPIARVEAISREVSVFNNIE